MRQYAAESETRNVLTEKYTGHDRRYAGEVDITYNLKRCIHAEYCVTRLSEVFDKTRRPWINADGAPIDQVTTVIEMCPSGALHYERKDGVTEAAPDRNVVRVRHNGPLEIHGDLSIHGTTVALERETRVALCRCGASSNKPFCDNSHKTISFQAAEHDRTPQPATSPGRGQLTITVLPNASLELSGELEIVNEGGEILFAGDSVWLCRCGGSSNKPFCDATHKRNGFMGE
jgi:CDGSH-type Zn-finger protein/uncharacterized Fe-S cluster protein YjdI